jgi:transcriptional regulator with GAF, ATPase, and Fis domain
VIFSKRVDSATAALLTRTSRRPKWSRVRARIALRSSAFPRSPATAKPRSPLDLEAYLESIRTQLMIQALERTNGVQTQAAELLGMSFRSFRYYVKKAGLKGGD